MLYSCTHMATVGVKGLMGRCAAGWMRGLIPVAGWRWHWSTERWWWRRWRDRGWRATERSQCWSRTTPTTWWRSGCSERTPGSHSSRCSAAAWTGSRRTGKLLKPPTHSARLAEFTFRLEKKKINAIVDTFSKNKYRVNRQSGLTL